MKAWLFMSYSPTLWYAWRQTLLHSIMSKLIHQIDTQNASPKNLKSSIYTRQWFPKQALYTAFSILHEKR